MDKSINLILYSTNSNHSINVINIQSTFNEILPSPEHPTDTQNNQFKRSHLLFVSIKIRTANRLNPASRILRIWNPIATMAPDLQSWNFGNRTSKRDTQRQPGQCLQALSDRRNETETRQANHSTTAIMLYVCTGWLKSACEHWLKVVCETAALNMCFVLFVSWHLAASWESVVCYEG